MESPNPSISLGWFQSVPIYNDMKRRAMIIIITALCKWYFRAPHRSEWIYHNDVLDFASDTTCDPPIGGESTTSAATRMKWRNMMMTNVMMTSSIATATMAKAAMTTTMNPGPRWENDDVSKRNEPWVLVLHDANAMTVFIYRRLRGRRRRRPI